MIKQATFLARRATRWWSAPVRFTANTVAALRGAAGDAERGSWLRHAPVGIRTPVNAQ